MHYTYVFFYDSVQEEGGAVNKSTYNDVCVIKEEGPGVIESSHSVSKPLEG